MACLPSRLSKGLSGSADDDQDGKVTMEKLALYIRPTSETHRFAQSPIATQPAGLDADKGLPIPSGTTTAPAPEVKNRGAAGSDSADQTAVATIKPEVKTTQQHSAKGDSATGPIPNNREKPRRLPATGLPVCGKLVGTIKRLGGFHGQKSGKQRSSTTSR